MVKRQWEGKRKRGGARDAHKERNEGRRRRGGHEKL